MKRDPTLTPPRPTILERYDFDAQVRALQDRGGAPNSTLPTIAPPSEEVGVVTKDFVPKKDVPLTPAAIEAVRVSERWLEETNSPAAGRWESCLLIRCWPTHDSLRSASRMHD